MHQKETPDNSASASNNWRQSAVIVAILGLAAAGLNLQWHTTSSNPATTQTNPDDLLPDTIVGHPVLDTFDNTGRKTRQLHGEKLTYFDTDKHSIISAPRIQFEQQNENRSPTPWQLSADTATIYQTNNRADLQGNVHLWNDSASDGRTEILTEQLSVDTARQFAETDKAVTIRARSSEAKATGLQADLANKHLLLPSRVKEIHEVRR
ncbi:MAG TPA: LPS export ABC transporter periplasmic protein LptC [Pseudomonadales bacterium]|nr:LPS export ABC transporter periplasmic protein LptC [Pseudomonadales bacterium]